MLKCFLRHHAGGVVEFKLLSEGMILYSGSLRPLMKSLTRYQEESAFSISISSRMFNFLWLFSRGIMFMMSSILHYTTFLNEVVREFSIIHPENDHRKINILEEVY